MKIYGIIGNPLGHSYSEKYFTELFIREGIEASYHAYPIDTITDALPLLESLEGMNVTYPYKEAIIPYLTAMDTSAKMIGAVNVVHKGKGYNTDWIGFRDSLRPLLREDDHRALLLGTGGVSKAIQYALRELRVEFTLVSRLGVQEARTLEGSDNAVRRLGYEEVDEEVMQTHTVIVNCTPLGMRPYEQESPNIPYGYLNDKHLLYDCIYNPAKTLFLQQGEKMGCKIKNGLEMLHLQADEAWKIWDE